jgi:hypothetical protein
MKEFDKLAPRKIEREEEHAAYRRGYREGVDVTVWAAIFLIGGLLAGGHFLGLL